MRLVSSSSSRFLNQKILRSYNAVYEHKGSTLAADSGDVYKDDIGNEYFEAHGNILIVQPSGSTIQGTHLHYDASSQHAVLTQNVKMIDGETTLTTNYLTYNMRSQQGTYTGGGRILSKGDTITSQRAYYFENTKDAYFNNKVVVRTPSALIYTDSLQYNTMYRDAFFFGPTNIHGLNGENLYTERGTYNTEFGVAKFNKNNLYTEGSKFLKGDSLFYDRDKGIGEAFRNVLFVDTLDKFYANGEYGKYLQAEESIEMTGQPLIKYLIRNDSTASNQADSSIDSLEVEKTLSKKEKRNLEKENKKNELDKEAEIKQDISLEDQGTTDSISTPPLDESPKVDTAYMTADTLYSRVIFVRDYKPLDLKLDRNGGQIEDDTQQEYGNIDEVDLFTTTDSTDVSADSLATASANKIETVKNEIIDSAKTIKKPILGKPKPIDSIAVSTTILADSLLRKNAVMPTGLEHDSLINNALQTAQIADTTFRDSTKIYADTARTRIVKAYYNVRVFKSDLQAVADSVYYGMVDSMFRFMGSPMIWSQGSQINADTIFMQISNGKMDNALLKDNAFMVNAVLDTLKFNQLKGRKITAFFANNNIEKIFVDGNAENLVFSTNDKTNTITEMFHDRSSRIKIRMENQKIIDYVSIRKVDQKIYPFRLVTQENEVLPGFLWKPEDRPKSVQDMLSRTRSKASPVVDSLNNTTDSTGVAEAVEDSTQVMLPDSIQTKNNPKKVIDSLEAEAVDASKLIEAEPDSTKLELQKDSITLPPKQIIENKQKTVPSKVR